MTRAARSLSGRLLAGAALWIAAALLITGLILSALFRTEVERTFAARLALSLEQLAANLETAPDGKVQLARPLSEPLFARPYSGWYWQVEDGGVLLRSRSLWDLALDLPRDELADGVARAVRRAIALSASGA
jgi:hypothetical protein